MIKVMITRASDSSSSDRTEVKEFENIEEMMNYCFSLHSELIIRKDPKSEYQNADEPYRTQYMNKYKDIDYLVTLSDVADLE